MSEPGKSLLFSSAAKLAVLLAFSFLVCARLPDAVIQGRFWAEEGRIYFWAAAEQHWFVALTTVHMGYLNLSATLGALAAYYLMPMASAPHLTMLIALLVQCLPVIILLNSRDDWLQNGRSLVFAIVVIAFAPAVLETWLTTISSQHHLTLAAALILSLEAQAGVTVAVYGGILFLAALSGPGTWMLLPLFLARAVIERNRARICFLICIAAGTAIAALFFVPSDRSVGMSPLLLGAITFQKHVAISLLPLPQASAIGRLLTEQFASGERPLWPMLLSICAFSLLCSAAIRTRSAAAIWLIMAGATLAGGSYLGALNDKLGLLDPADGGRYAFAPQALFSIACAQIAYRSSSKAKAFWTVFLGYVVLIQVVNLPRGREFDRGPNWSAEVSRFQSGETNILRIWPPGWELALCDRPMEKRPSGCWP
ncbi:hypothetical protein [Afipia sp. GAS231]|uniref:hypothetical protein n=1 Tax=Afipia sp. GAS231 TaxID=1882747 RepID=UPI00087929FA|nr:hypothetical protein [Afipia sp. GAS231]SDO35162.1 hypothetical protein SAMN05444050_3922 [Afipia sp. GAS231]